MSSIDPCNPKQCSNLITYSKSNSLQKSKFYKSCVMKLQENKNLCVYDLMSRCIKQQEEDLRNVKNFEFFQQFVNNQ